MPINPDKGIYPSAAEVKQNLHTKLSNKRTELLKTKLYVGDPSFMSNADSLVAWARIGYNNVLCTKDSVDRANTEMDHKTAQSFEQPEEQDGEDGGAKDAESSSEAIASELEPAMLSVVVQITPQDYWLVSCGMWKGPSVACQAFEDMKLSCTGAAAEHDVFQKDFSVALDNLRKLMNKTATPGFTTPAGFIKNNKLKFRHVLFAKKINGTDGEHEYAVDAEEELGPQFKIENWPAHHENAQNALQNLKDTHTVVPVPAYDMHGKLIEPQNYRKYLEGALVRITFSLNHWSIGKKTENTYGADIKGIRVLLPPSTSAPVTPRKKRVYGSDPFDTPRSSPSKKTRV